MPISVVGALVGQAFAQQVKDPTVAAKLPLLGAFMGGSPTGLVLLSVMARQNSESTTTGGAPGPGGPGPTPPQAPTETEVPDVTGSDVDEATALLTARSLRVTGTARVLSEEIMDTVVGSTPESQSIVKLGTGVLLHVSAGLPVPSVVGRKEDDARSVLSTAGFRPEIVLSESGASPLVVRQEPGAGEYASYESEVLVHMNKRDEPKRIGAIELATE